MRWSIGWLGREGGTVRAVLLYSAGRFHVISSMPSIAENRPWWQTASVRASARAVRLGVRSGRGVEWSGGRMMARKRVKERSVERGGIELEGGVERVEVE